ncbi:hypothetical protein ACFZBU_29600 [Embleya sp. NPDC008237]|uniref:hypothetical protein n=1 Tax=Embleya sp. NPDC008237 TaxID=3363978 RepID=UPI0036E0B6D8
MAGAAAGGPRAGRRFPTGGNYVEALQHPDLCFRDPDLRHGTVQQSAVLGPRAISGNFASVFSVTTSDGRRYAVKCFTREIEAQEVRYRAISAHLAGLDPTALSQPWPVGFEYLPDGVMVNGRWYPVLKMTWVDGIGLIDWVDDHRRDRTAMADLARRFAALTTDLEAHGIGHGDLQHGNLLVAADGTFRLVDYDGMYVPALRGYLANESGHRNYQSPNRSAADFGPAMDRFSAWVVYLALAATATDPEVWEQLHDSRGEYLLLSEPDFADPTASFAWATLLGHRDPALRDLAMRVQAHLRSAPEVIPALRAESVTIPAPRPGGASAPRPASGTASAPGGHPLPAWVADRVVAPAAGNGAARPADPIPTGVGFTGRRPGDLVAAATAMLLALTPMLLLVLGLLSALLGAITEVGALGLAFGCVEASRRRRVESRAARHRIRTLRVQAAPLRAAAVLLRDLDSRAERLDHEDRDRDATTAAALRNLHADQQREQDKLATTLQRHRTDTEARLRGLPAREATLLAEASRARVEAAVREALRNVSIRDAENLTNMGTKTVGALVQAGIRTAADFTGVRYASGGSYNTVTAEFRLAGGRYVRVHGIGETRARTLETWRDGLAARARRAAEKAVDPSIRAHVRDRIATERATLKRGLQEAEARNAQARTALLERITAERVRLTDAREAGRVDTDLRRTGIRRERVRHQGSVDALERLAAVLASERDAARYGLGRRRYVGFVLRGR